MKTFFLTLAVVSLALSIYFYFNRFDGNRQKVKMIEINNGEWEEKIKYAGDIQLADDEKAIKSISKDGFIEFTLNGRELKIENNKEGAIGYKFFRNGERQPFDQQGRQFVALAIHEMIAHGFDAEKRLERLYRTGGSLAVLHATDSTKNDYIRAMYLARLLKENLPPEDLEQVTRRISHLGTSAEKTRFLCLYTPAQLKDARILDAWLDGAASLVSGPEKQIALKHIAGRGIVTDTAFVKVSEIINSCGSDIEKREMTDLFAERDKMPRVNN